MFKHKLTISDYLLILVNLIPIYGVWMEGWDPKMIFIVYCLESVIIGLVNVLKMAIVTIFFKSKDEWNNNGVIKMVSGFFFIGFFIVHYGFFIFVQTQIFFGITGMSKSDELLSSYSNLPALLGKEGKLLLAIFILYYTLQTFYSFFSTGQYKTTSLMKIMFEPYMRIFVQQFIVILGSFFLIAGAGKMFILVFAFVKIFSEVYVNFNRFLNIAERKHWNMEEKKKD